MTYSQRSNLINKKEETCDRVFELKTTVQKMCVANTATNHRTFSIEYNRHISI